MHEVEVDLVSLKKAVWPIRVAHRERINAVARWSLVRGRPVPMEHTALIIGAKLRGQDDVHLDHWTTTRVAEVLHRGVGAWCAAERTLVPDQLAESLWTYLHFLAEQALLTPDSDPLARLIAPLRDRG